MQVKKLALSIVAVLVAGCSTSSNTSWMPWVKVERETGAKYLPPGATAYACEGGKRLLVRFESDRKSAWIIYPDRELRLDRVTASSGEEFSRAGTTLSVKEGDTMLTEGSAVQFTSCKPEAKS